MLIETYPEGVRMLEGTPNIVVSIRPGQGITLQLMADEQKDCYSHIRRLDPGQDPVPVAREMFEAVLRRLAGTAGAS